MYLVSYEKESNTLTTWNTDNLINWSKDWARDKKGNTYEFDDSMLCLDMYAISCAMEEIVARNKDYS